MLESLTIFNQGGLILYQYRANPSLMGNGSKVGGPSLGSGNAIGVDGSISGSSKGSTKKGGGGSTKKGNKNVIKINSNNIKKTLKNNSIGANNSTYNNNNDESSVLFTQEKINAWIDKILLGHDPPILSQQKPASTGAGAANAKLGPGGGPGGPGSGSAFLIEYLQCGADKFAVAVYPDIFFDGPRAYLKNWVQTLMQLTVEEYEQLYQYETKKQQHLQSLKQKEAEEENKEGEEKKQDQEALQLQQQQKLLLIRPDPKEFDSIFFNILNQSKSKHPPPNSSSDAESSSMNEPQQQQNLLSDNNSSTNIVATKPLTSSTKSSSSSKKGKEKRTWHDGKNKVTKEAMAELDKSLPTDNNEEAQEQYNERLVNEARAIYLPSEQEQQEEQELEKQQQSSEDTSWIGSSFKGIMDQMTGNKVLSEEDLKVPLQNMQKLLTSKNVASEVATAICSGVQEKLIGKKLNSFYRVQTAVKQALEATITKLLTPSKPINILYDVQTQRTKNSSAFSSLLGNNNKKGNNPNRPYVIVVVGINGVGKSTSLAKLAYYLKANGCRPLLAACDTFRSGAVEQLNVHARCLDIPLYSKGYAKDPSIIAKAAIEFAQNPTNDKGEDEEPYDVVLIDTAGRMQNNVPLMKALGKLVYENQPNLILLVSEALVGNDGMDQLRMFNKAIVQSSSSARNARNIDAVILTKFDTVSDKVGAALTMTQITNTPILFVGTGQKYHHLKPLSVQSVITSLFS